MTQSKRGGARPGAGRPKGTTKEVHNPRPQHQVRAFDDEWLLIKKFTKLVKTDKEKAAALLAQMNS